jgi:hypothetical protein
MRNWVIPFVIAIVILRLWPWSQPRDEVQLRRIRSYDARLRKAYKTYGRRRLRGEQSNKAWSNALKYGNAFRTGAK